MITQDYLDNKDNKPLYNLTSENIKDKTSLKKELMDLIPKHIVYLAKAHAERLAGLTLLDGTIALSPKFFYEVLPAEEWIIRKMECVETIIHEIIHKKRLLVTTKGHYF